MITLSFINLFLTDLNFDLKNWSTEKLLPVAAPHVRPLTPVLPEQFKQMAAGPLPVWNLWLWMLPRVGLLSCHGDGLVGRMWFHFASTNSFNLVVLLESVRLKARAFILTDSAHLFWKSTMWHCWTARCYGNSLFLVGQSLMLIVNFCILISKRKKSDFMYLHALRPYVLSSICLSTVW